MLKGQSVIRNGRLQFDAGWVDLAASFMAIKQRMTKRCRPMQLTQLSRKRIANASSTTMR
nr:hypothetical protein [Burkholderia mayonis]